MSLKVKNAGSPGKRPFAASAAFSQKRAAAEDGINLCLGWIDRMQICSVHPFLPSGFQHDQ
jgi:hypothetical protein